MKSVSPFRFVGGKTRLLPDLYEYLPKTCHNYWEPFVGGGALFFDYGWRRTGTAFLSDINWPLINAYNEIEYDLNEVRQVVDELQDLPYSVISCRFNEWKKDLDAEGRFDSTTLAGLFIAVNHLCFNGVYRENKKGEFNVPVGRNSKGIERSLNSIDWDAFEVAAKKLSTGVVNINCIPFEPFSCPIAPIKGDVWFADSPYLKEFSQYSKNGFTVDDHKALAAQALMHAESGATVIVCGSNNDASKAIYGEPTKVVELSRTVGHSKRKKATEALWVWNGVK